MSVSELLKGINDKNRYALSKSLTLIESTKSSDQELAADLINGLTPNKNKTKRIAITGIPGVGKSTFINAYGSYLASQNHRVAILAIDPSSTVSKGSILGDKTRMHDIANNENVYIRPTANNGHLGGIAKNTYHSILLCEAAGFDTILIETVGVGQSEISVRNISDFVLMLTVIGTGDDLQGIKRGIMEVNNAIVINKADLTDKATLTKTVNSLKQSVHFLNANPNWESPVLTCSSEHKEGFKQVHYQISDFFEKAHKSGTYISQRKQQKEFILKDHLKQIVWNRFSQLPSFKEQLAQQNAKMLTNSISPFQAAQEILDALN